MKNNLKYQERLALISFTIILIVSVVSMNYIIPNYFSSADQASNFTNDEINKLDSIVVQLDRQKELAEKQSKKTKKRYYNNYDNNKKYKKKYPKKQRNEPYANSEKNSSFYEKKNWPDNIDEKKLADTITSINHRNHHKEDIPDWLKEKMASEQFQIDDVNKSTTEELEKLRGIGPVLARRIIKFRDALGGFHSIDQIAETYGLPPETFSAIKSKLKVKSQVQKIAINTMSKDSLAYHGLFNYKQAGWIIAYRQQHGPFYSPEDLLSLRMIDSSQVAKWAPYLSFDTPKDLEVEEIAKISESEPSSGQ